MKYLLSTHQAAQILGVSDASLKRWCDKGLIESQRTGGGHRRITLNAVMEYLRRNGHDLPRADLPGLPRVRRRGPHKVEEARQLIAEALETGDEERFQRLAFDLYQSGMSACDLFDRILREVFHRMGHRWEHGRLEVYQERRACEICLRWLHELQSRLPPPSAQAPRALGGTVQGDPYTLPTAMVEVVLREAGWQAVSYGANLPFDTLLVAVRHNQPRICWVSVSHVQNEKEFLDGCDRLYEETVRCGTALVLGGRLLTDDIRQRMRYSAYCDCLRHIVSFIESLGPGK